MRSVTSAGSSHDDDGRCVFDAANVLSCGPAGERVSAVAPHLPVVGAKHQFGHMRGFADDVAARLRGHSRGEGSAVPRPLKVAQLVDRRCDGLGGLVDRSQLLAARPARVGERGQETQLIEGEVETLVEVDTSLGQHSALLEDKLADGLQEVLRRAEERAGVIDIALDACQLLVESFPTTGLKVDASGRNCVAVVIKRPVLLAQ